MTKLSDGSMANWKRVFQKNVSKSLKMQLRNRKWDKNERKFNVKFSQISKFEQFRIDATINWSNRPKISSLCSNIYSG